VGEFLLTVFSNMDFCGKNGNAAAVLIIKKNLEVVPKVIYPSEGLARIKRWENYEVKGEINDENANQSFILNNVKNGKDDLKIRRKNMTPLR
jgi:hypothetical protein